MKRHITLSALHRKENLDFKTRSGFLTYCDSEARDGGLLLSIGFQNSPSINISFSRRDADEVLKFKDSLLKNKIKGTFEIGQYTITLKDEDAN